MHVEQHVIAGTIAATGVAWYVSPSAGASVLAANALMDMDHYLWYLLRFRDWSPKRALKFFRAKKADDYYCLCVFHTLEAIALYVVCLWMNGLIFWISAGCLLHIVLDVAYSIWDRGLLRRKWSLIHAVFFLINLRLRNDAKPKV